MNYLPARFSHQLRKGFTLIELLVVIAVLGILAAVVLVAVDPLEQIARGRDSGRINTVAQLGHALQAYATSSGTYPPADTSWQQALVTAGELKQPVTVSAAANNCSAASKVGNICYKVVGTEAVVYTVLDSKNSKSKVATSGVPCSTTTLAVYSTAKGQAGILCIATADSVTGTEDLK